MCIKYRVLYFIFKLLYARRYGSPGSLVRCNDGLDWTVVYNDDQSTVVIYREDVFRIVTFYGGPLPSVFNICSADICTYDDEKRMRNFTRRPIRPLRIMSKKTSFIAFLEMLEEFQNVIAHYDMYQSAHDSDISSFVFKLLTHHIIHLHYHLKYLCERHALCIQRMFKTAISDPAYVLCRRRLRREFEDLTQTTTS
jgi:hypothetical protein